MCVHLDLSKLLQACHEVPVRRRLVAIEKPGARHQQRAFAHGAHPRCACCDLAKILQIGRGGSFMIAASESGSPPGTHRMSSAGTSAKLACASKRTPLMEVTGLPSSDTST